MEEAKTRLGYTTDPRYIDRYHGPDDMTKHNATNLLAEFESKAALLHKSPSCDLMASGPTIKNTCHGPIQAQNHQLVRVQSRIDSAWINDILD